MKRPIVLIGHGGVAKDYPRDRLTGLRLFYPGPNRRILA